MFVTKLVVRGSGIRDTLKGSGGAVGHNFIIEK